MNTEYDQTDPLYNIAELLDMSFRCHMGMALFRHHDRSGSPLP